MSAQFDEALLDDAAQLALADRHRMLWSLATAGAQVRRAVETVADFGVEAVRADDPPRAVLVATDPASGGVARVLTRLAGSRAPALAWHGAELPRWSGPADALLVGAVDGRHPRLAQLAADADRRGLAVVVVAPAASPVTAAVAGRAPVHELPRDLTPLASRWAVLTPLLQALEAFELAMVPPSLLVEVADALDSRAEVCRPDSDAFTNPAKSLATEFDEAVPLVAGAGALAGVAARVVVDALTAFAGVPALAVALPDDVGRAAGVLRAAARDDTAAEQDFFRDRADGAAPARPRLLVIGDDGNADDTLLGERSAVQIELDEVAARRAAAALHALARSLGLRSSGVDVPAGEPLCRFAAATAFGDFTAVYLALGRGLAPGDPGDVVGGPA